MSDIPDTGAKRYFEERASGSQEYQDALSAARAGTDYEGPPPVRKGDQAAIALRDPRDPGLAVAMDDLVALEAHGALAGVAEILRERRRQIEAKGYTARHDDSLDGQELIAEASNRLAELTRQQAEGTAGYPEYDTAYRQAGALLAAEIDRLGRMMQAQEVGDDGR